MKVVYINTNYYPNMIGGTEVSLKSLAENMNTKGHNVHVICTGENNKEDNIYGINIHYIGIRKTNIVSRNVNELFGGYMLSEAIKKINAIVPDIVHTNNIFPFSPLIWKYMKKSDIPVVHTIRDYYLIGSKVEFKNYYFKKMTKYISYVTAASHYTLDSHIRKGLFNKCMRCVIANSINFDISNIKILKERRKNCKKDIIHYAFLGRMTCDKGVLDLIVAFEKWKSNHILHFFGDGELVPFILQKGEKNKNIIYEGFVDQHKIHERLNDIDVIIVPTKATFQEPFGRVVLDAYKSMIPVIASNVGGLPEIVDHMKTGLLVTPSDIPELIAAMKYFENRNEIISMYDNIEKELKKYTTGTQVKKFESIYQGLIYNKKTKS